MITSWLFAMTLVTLVAQPRQHGPQLDEATREAVKTYVQDNILPVLKEQRIALDGQLSAADQAEVDELRAEAKALKEAQKAKMEERKKLHESLAPGEKPDLSEEEKAAMHEDRKEMMKAQRKLMTRAWAVIDNNESAVEGILDGLRDEVQTWREDLKDMVGERSEGERPRGQQGRGRGDEGRPGPEGEAMDMHRRGPGGPGMGGPAHVFGLLSPVRFLLWDPSQEPEDLIEGQGFQTFPNPAQSTNTLTFEVASPGQVQIQLLNQGGQVVRQVADQPMEAGAHTLQVDLSGLKKGLYFYQIKTGNTVKTEKLIVK